MGCGAAVVQLEGGQGESWRNETGTGGRSRGGGGEAEGHSEELHPERSDFKAEESQGQR